MSFRTLEEARTALLKEEQDYLDALQAYNEILGQTAATKPMSGVFETMHSPLINGHEQAANQPYIIQQHPDLARAADRLITEESEYRAVDEAVASFTQGNCSIGQYTAEKVYEYYAALEMVYKLATDAEFRALVLQQIYEAYTGSALDHYMRANRLQDHADRLMQVKPDWLDYLLSDAEGDAALDERDAAIKAELEEIGRLTDFHMQAAEEKVKAYFLQMWEDIKRRYNECGLFYAVTTVGVDGTFLAAEIYAGLAFLRALKFARRLLPDGRIRIDVQAESGRTLGTQTYSKEALEAKYGTPEENHLGGYEPDTNRQLPDQEAEDVLAEKRRAEADEANANRQDVREDGSYRNSSDPDGVRRAPDGEAMVEENGEWKRISETSNNTKGKFGEMMADDHAANQTPPWEKLNGDPATMDTPGHQGIDGVYRDPGPPPRVIVADAKYGSAGLGTLVDGTRQMSPKWVRDRLEDAVGEDAAFDIGDSYEPVVMKIDKDGNVTEQPLNEYPWREEDQ